MINESNNKTIRYIASACFVLLALLIVIRVLSGTGNYKAISYLYLFGLIMIAVSIIKLIPLIGAIGSGCCCIYSLVSLFSIINQVRSYGWPVIDNIGLHMFLEVIVWILLLIAFLIPESSKAMGITAGVLGFVATISLLYRDILWGSFRVLGVNGLIPYVKYALFIVGAILIGLSANAHNKNGRQSFSEGNHKDELSDQIDRLTKLKTLLDNGVITQEEFNAKKDEIWDNSVK